MLQRFETWLESDEGLHVSTGLVMVAVMFPIVMLAQLAVPSWGPVVAALVLAYNLGRAWSERNVARRWRKRQ